MNFFEVLILIALIVPFFTLDKSNVRGFYFPIFGVVVVSYGLYRYGHLALEIIR
jgi:hypothetical protein